MQNSARIADIVNILRSSKIAIFDNTLIALGDTFHLSASVFLFCSDRLRTKILLLSNTIVPGLHTKLYYTFTVWNDKANKRRRDGLNKSNSMSINSCLLSTLFRYGGCRRFEAHQDNTPCLIRHGSCEGKIVYDR